MSVEIERLLGGEHLKRGVSIIPYIEGHKYSAESEKQMEEIFPIGNDSKIHYFYGAKANLPDKLSMNATKQVVEMCKNLTENDILLTLVSGGGSALLTQPIHLIDGDLEKSLTFKLETIKSLVKSGADINELNTVTLCGN